MKGKDRMFKITCEPDCPELFHHEKINRIISINEEKAQNLYKKMQEIDQECLAAVRECDEKMESEGRTHEENMLDLLALVTHLQPISAWHEHRKEDMDWLNDHIADIKMKIEKNGEKSFWQKLKDVVR